MAKPADMAAQRECERHLREAGVHFGHQVRRWNPKMRRFISSERDGIYIIDLFKTAQALEQAQRFAESIACRGGTVLFVGTKQPARDAIQDVAESCGMPYVSHRWLGGILANFETISQRIRRLHDLERYEAEGQLALLPTRERLAAQADLARLRANLGGVRDMQRLPDAMFVIDLNKEAVAVREAQRLRIPIIGLVNTDVDPDGIEYVIPGNDDAVESCRAIAEAIGEGIRSGRAVWQHADGAGVHRSADASPGGADKDAAHSSGDHVDREAHEPGLPDSVERAEHSNLEATIADLLPPDVSLSARDWNLVHDLLMAVGDLWEAETSRTWLLSPNGYLDGSRPMDVLLARGPEEVRDALDAALSGAYA